MTHESTENLISKILDNPDCLSDSEIADILHDDYLCDLYHTASLLKSASTPSRRYNLDHDWEDLMNRLNGFAHVKVAYRKRRWTYVAAAFIGIIICGAIAMALFRLSDSCPAYEALIAACRDSILNDSAIVESVASIETFTAADSPSMAKDTAAIILPARTQKASQALAKVVSDEEADNRGEYPLPSIDQALLLTDGDVIVAQMHLSPFYEASQYESENFVTTVNYGDCRREEVGQPVWLSEFMKYAMGLTDLNSSVRRGSANMLYRLTCSASGESDVDREGAASIISSLIADGICDFDPIIKVLVLGSHDNLK